MYPNGLIFSQHQDSTAHCCTDLMRHGDQQGVMNGHWNILFFFPSQNANADFKF